MVILDGVADMCNDVNDIKSCNSLVSALMRISQQNNCHIINVIHQNFGSAKLGTGHLGSALEKKSETTIVLEEKGTHYICSTPTKLAEYDSYRISPPNYDRIQ